MTFEEALSKGVPMLCWVSDTPVYHKNREMREIYTLSKKHTPSAF